MLALFVGGKFIFLWRNCPCDGRLSAENRCMQLWLAK